MPRRPILPACLLLVLTALSTPTAQTAADAVLLIEFGAHGIVPGQVLRATLTNLRAGRTLRVASTVLDANGQVLARTGNLDVPAGQFRMLDVSRADLAPAGDPGTGRLQVRTALRVVVPGVTSTAVLQQLSTQLTASLVVFNATTGQDESGMIGDIRTVISAEAGP
jgi:hypothetical protein